MTAGFLSGQRQMYGGKTDGGTDFQNGLGMDGFCQQGEKLRGVRVQGARAEPVIRVFFRAF